MSRTNRTRALAVLLFLLVAACGSTSKKTDVAGSGDPSGSSSASPTDIGSSSSQPGATTGPGGSSGSGGPGSSATVTGEAGRKPAPIVRGGGAVHLGTGVTDKTIKIGFNHSAPLGPAFALVGFGGTPEGENTERIIIDALVKHMNAHGGLAGRKIVPIYYEYDATESDSWDVVAEQACQKFINDEKVFAVVAGHVGGTDALAACMAKGKTPLVQQNQWPYDGKYFKDYANYLYQPSRMRPERWVPAYIAGLKDAGYFNAGYKLGLMRFDEPVFDRIATLIKNELKKRGLVLTSEAVIGTPHSVSAFGQMSTEISSATLRFRQDGVTHVIFDEWAGQMPFFGLTVADQQDFRPRYGFTSVNLTNTQALQHEPSQLNGSVVVSWLPGQDVGKADDPRRGGAHARCAKIFTDAGIAPNRLYNGTFCDSLFFLDQTLSTTNNITPAGLGAASAKLGTSYDSPYTWDTLLELGRPDGGSAVRLGKYVEACTCYRYTSGDRPAG